MSKVDDLREFKQLLDEGLITEDEYNRKKKQILELDDSITDDQEIAKEEKENTIDIKNKDYQKEQKKQTEEIPPKFEEPIQEKKKFQLNKKAIIALAILAVVAIVAIVVTQSIIPGKKYDEAMELLENKSYPEAYEEFSSLGNYKDSNEQANKAILSELNGTVLYCKGDGTRTTWVLHLNTNGVSIKTFDFTDYSTTTLSSEQGTMSLDDGEYMTITIEGKTPLKIAYKIENNQIVIDDKNYMTKEEIEKELEGTWSATFKTSLGYTDSRYLKLDNGSMTIVKVNGTYTSSRYVYWGPYSGTYTVGIGKFDTDTEHGNEYYWTISNGEIVIYDFTTEETLSKTNESIPSESEVAKNY